MQIFNMVPEKLHPQLESIINQQLGSYVTGDHNKDFRNLIYSLTAQIIKFSVTNIDQIVGDLVKQATADEQPNEASEQGPKNSASDEVDSDTAQTENEPPINTQENVTSANDTSEPTDNSDTTPQSPQNEQFFEDSVNDNSEPTEDLRDPDSQDEGTVPQQ